MDKIVEYLNFEEIYQADNGLDRFCEMSNYRKRKTGLPVNVWIDQAENYKDGGQAKRIKFQTNKADRYQNNSCPMLLDGTIPVNEYQKAKADKEFNISESEINEVRNFVLNNSYALDKVADQLIFEDEFDQVFIHGGAPASEEEKYNLKIKVDAFMQNHNG